MSGLDVIIFGFFQQLHCSNASCITDRIVVNAVNAARVECKLRKEEVFVLHVAYVLRGEVVACSMQ